MLKKGNVIMFFIFVVFSIFLTPLFGKVYELIIGRKISGWFWGLAHPEYFEGFFLSVALILILGTILFSGKFRYWIVCIILFLEFLLLLVSRSFESLIVDACAAVIAIVLGEAILFAQRKMTANK
jgi:hypothetical protein